MKYNGFEVIIPMRTNKKISIIIPAYNEADRLADCLNAIAALDLAPYEVLVVDNNSTDDTRRVAKQFSFVTLLHARQQGVVHARTLGFNKARGEIIARIDADTLVSPDWTLQLQQIFTDPEIAAVSGSIEYHDVAFRSFIAKIDLVLRAWLARRMAGRVFLQGANMAIRRSAWQLVSHDLCERSRMHEDLDLAIHLADSGQKVIYSPQLMAGISGRRADTSPKSFYDYVMLNPQTYKYHDAREYRYMYAIIMIVLLCYLPLRVLFRSYDSKNQQFSWRLLFADSTAERVNPAIF